MLIFPETGVDCSCVGLPTQIYTGHCRTSISRERSWEPTCGYIKIGSHLRLFILPASLLRSLALNICCYMFRMSGIWGYQTALDLYLEQHGIKTLIFAGVNADQVGLPSLCNVFILTQSPHSSVFWARSSTPIIAVTMSF